MSGLSTMATAVYSTKRNPAVDASVNIGDRVTHLTGVNCVPIMPLVSSGVGTIQREPNAPKTSLSGAVKDYWVTFAESQVHIDGGVSVDQVPDILEKDTLVVGSVEYIVNFVENWPATTALLAFIKLELKRSW